MADRFQVESWTDRIVIQPFLRDGLYTEQCAREAWMEHAAEQLLRDTRTFLSRQGEAFLQKRLDPLLRGAEYSLVEAFRSFRKTKNTSWALEQAMAQGLVEMYAEIGAGLYNSKPRTPENTTPASFRQWCEEVFKPALQR